VQTLDKNTISKVLEAAIEASILINKKQLSQDFEINKKLDNSYITSVDITANMIIKSYLSQTNIPIISEEDPMPPYDERKTWKRFWLVDPLDGTWGFIKNRDYAINIALIEEQKPVFGLIALPKDQCVYWNQGKQVMKSDLTGKYNTLNRPYLPDHEIDDGICFLQSPKSALSEKYYARIIHNFNIKQLQSIGASKKYTEIIEGNSHIYLREKSIYEWDTAAGHALLNAMDMPFVDINTHEPILYNKKQLLVGNFLCYNHRVIPTTKLNFN